MSEETTSVESTDLPCTNCGQTLSAFLHQMQEHNAKIVCPACGKEHHHQPTPAEGKEAPVRKLRKL